jgi:lysophospholipase L1-like esterase
VTQIPQVKELNQKLVEWTQGKDWVRYVESSGYLADAQGQPIRDYYVDDLLHLSPSGYAKWTEILKPVLAEEWAKVK